MVSAADVILDYIVPLIGTGLAIAMFLAPVPDVLKNLERGTINDLNPLPWVFMLGNCTGWTLYSVLVQDIWLLAANAPGILISAWLNLAASKLKYQEQFHQMPAVTQKHDAALELEQQKQEVDPDDNDADNDATDHHNNTNNENENRHPLLSQRSLKVLSQRSMRLAAATSQRSLLKLNEVKELDDEEPVGGGAATASTMDGKPMDGGSGSDTSSESDETDALRPGAMRTYQSPQHDKLIMGMATSWLCIVAFVGFGTEISSDVKELVVGIITNFNLLFFYGAPLSTIAAVLQTRNTASIHVPTMVMNTLTSLFWAIYGLTIFDPFVFVPNGIGTFLGIVQVVLYVIFPRKVDDTPNAIAAQVVIGDIAADAIVVGDPTSENAVVMINKEDMERLQHSVAIDQNLGGVQVITAGVPAFAPEEAVRIEEEQRRKYGDLNDGASQNRSGRFSSRNVMAMSSPYGEGGGDVEYMPPILPSPVLAKQPSSRKHHRLTPSFGTIQFPLDASEGTAAGGLPMSPTASGDNADHVVSEPMAAGLVPLINVSKFRRAGVDVGQILDAAEQQNTLDHSQMDSPDEENQQRPPSSKSLSSSAP